MSASLFFAPQARFFTPSIQSMDGAYLQFYVTQSTTPADVYADAGLNTSLGSVVTADINGQFVPIYLDSATTYRILLYDVNDVLQWDIDPYLPSRDYAPGTIIQWYGAAIDLDTYYPPGLWQICDGTNSSPDMAGRVAIGTGGGFAIGDEGGAVTANFTTDTDGEHIHSSVTSGAHALTTGEMPSHVHGPGVGTGFYNVQVGAATADGGNDFPIGATANTGATGDGGTHTHPNGEAAVDDSAHAHLGTVDIMQPYRAIYMLMRRYP